MNVAQENQRNIVWQNGCVHKLEKDIPPANSQRTASGEPTKLGGRGTRCVSHGEQIAQAKELLQFICNAPAAKQQTERQENVGRYH